MPLALVYGERVVTLAEDLEMAARVCAGAYLRSSGAAVAGKLLKCSVFVIVILVHLAK